MTFEQDTECIPGGFPAELDKKQARILSNISSHLAVILGFFCDIRRSYHTRHLNSLVIDGRIILKCILKKSVGRVWTGFFRDRLEICGEL